MMTAANKEENNIPEEVEPEEKTWPQKRTVLDKTKKHIIANRNEPKMGPK